MQEDGQTKQKRRELEAALAARARALQKEHQRLQAIASQAKSMDATEQRSIQQLQTEIARVSADLASETKRLVRAEERLAAATTTLQEMQREKAVLSEEMMDMMLEMEEGAAASVRNVEVGLSKMGLMRNGAADGDVGE